MAQKTKRIRRATLRGWWKVLPYLACPTILLMTFAYWEAERLQNQYRRIDLVNTMQELRKEIEYLHDNNRDLTRIEVMDEKAPTWALVEPDPDQIVIVPSGEVEKALSEIQVYRADSVTARLPTRTVLMHLDYAEEVAVELLDPVEHFEAERARMAYEVEETD